MNRDLALLSLEMIASTFRIRRRCSRAKYSFTKGGWKLREAWRDLITNECIRVGKTDVDFNFFTTGHGGCYATAWAIPPTYIPPSVEYENKRIERIGLLCSIARSMMSKECHIRLVIDALKRREWGRVIIWAQANLGQSQYKTERDETERGGARPSLGGMEISETESD